MMGKTAASQERRKQPQHAEKYLLQQVAAEFLQRDLMRFGECVFKVGADLRYFFRIKQAHAVLEVQVERAVVEVLRADDGDPVIADEGLAVIKARRIGKNPDAAADQRIELSIIRYGVKI